MQNTKRSITLKVVTGYVLIAILVVVAVWFIYNRVVMFSNMAQSNSNNNAQLFLVSEITSDLYETENVSRRLIQTGTKEDIKLYQQQLDSIKLNLIELDQEYDENNLHTELDSIYKLLDLKTENLGALLKLREQERNTNYYKQVMEELNRVNENFEANQGYEDRFNDLEPYQKKVLVKWLEYAKEDNAKSLTNQTADSLVSAVKKVLNDFQKANIRFRNSVFEKENDLLDNDMVLNQQLRKILANIEQDEREASIERTEKAQQTLEDTVSIIMISGSVCVIVILLFLMLIIRDVRRSQQYRIELEEAKNFAETLLKRREQLMAAITHDLRSPLNTVIGYSDLLDKTQLASKQQHYLRQINKSSEFILHLVNDLLDLSKLEAGKMLVENLPFNPRNLITDTVQNNIPAKQNNDLEIKIEVSEEADAQFSSDPFRIKQIIANLVTNAIKFTEKGEILVTGAIQKKAKNSSWLIIKVKDTGIGISKAKQEVIFEEFSQENSGIEKKYGGSGLGLTITKSLTSLLKGKIELQSDQGKGSEFTVSIPVKELKKKDANNKQIEPTPKTQDIDFGNKKVLVVDDEPAQLALTLEFLKSHQLKFDTAENGKKALALLNKNQYDLILTDIQMPIMDGFQLMNNIKKDERLKKIPIIALSGRTDMKDEVYKLTGFTAKLTKPFKAKDLLMKISEIFDLSLTDRHVSAESKYDSSSNETELYNLEDIYMFSGEDKEAMLVIIKAFIESSEESIEKLKHHNKEQNLEAIGQIAHKMLPMIRQMKVLHLITILEKLERKQETTVAEVNQLINQLEILVQSLETEITA
ncbi:hybrid sensor histidine kinase/response regulator [Zunongwangia sp. HGR-M22]|uniref:hybrid sensor histidine kinase/response regulator n=1 Tax=Zunongwangia sp. HGR-M22 TaxID=3015168 RepID=UPI0022DDFC04|nr:ATP-binding protein [Zunongwangia sp. HGR-M22]WBL25377.1 ATP-binding protein [Zunongwangia sp. HGR-M22]